MKVTFPRMGNMTIPLQAFFNALGVEVVVPPPITEKTISLGSRYSPEFACLPLKINIGNYLEAFELGADTLIMAGGIGPCRFGYYAQVQREILDDLGITYEMVVLEPPRGHLWETLGQLWRLTGRANLRALWQAGKLAWSKLQLVDEIDRLTATIRCRENNPGDTARIRRQALTWLERAGKLAEVARLREKIPEAFLHIEQKPGASPLRVGLIGEIYTLLEPAANLYLEDFLADLGVEVVRSIYLSEWVLSNLFLDTLRLRKDQEKIEEIAKPYLGHFVGGHGLENIGNTIKYVQEGLSGVIHLGPLTCMPEIVAKSILPRLSQDLDIPIYSFLLDEHTGETGLQTRLEAFVEMLKVRREKKLALGTADPMKCCLSFRKT